MFFTTAATGTLAAGTLLPGSPALKGLAQTTWCLQNWQKKGREHVCAGCLQAACCWPAPVGTKARAAGSLTETVSGMLDPYGSAAAEIVSASWSYAHAGLHDAAGSTNALPLGGGLWAWAACLQEYLAAWEQAAARARTYST